MVYSGLYPIDGSDYPELREALDKLRLNDAALTYEPETSAALGFGFRCRLPRPAAPGDHPRAAGARVRPRPDLDRAERGLPGGHGGRCRDHRDQPERVPDRQGRRGLRAGRTRDDPRAQRLHRRDHGALPGPARQLLGMDYLSEARVELRYTLPLGEIIFDFFDQLKSRPRATRPGLPEAGEQEADLVKVDILLQGEPVDAFSAIVHKDKAYSYGVPMAGKLRELIPRQQFEVPIQAAIGSRVIARETIRAIRKDVLAKCYGGDITRKRKLLEKQKEGKKRMKMVGRVEVPQEAFIAALSTNESTASKKWRRGSTRSASRRRDLPPSPRAEGTRRTGIDKQPVAGRVAVHGARSGRRRPGQQEVPRRRGPGGLRLRPGGRRPVGRRARPALPPGRFGENLRTSGLDLTGAVIGERWRIGTALLEVTAPRIPCANFARFWGVPELIKRFTAHGASGAYLRVLEPGEIGAGDTVEVVSRPDHGVTIGLAFRAFTTERRRLADLACRCSTSCRQGSAEGRRGGGRTDRRRRLTGVGALLSAAVRRDRPGPTGRSDAAAPRGHPAAGARVSPPCWHCTGRRAGGVADRPARPGPRRPSTTLRACTSPSTSRGARRDDRTSSRRRGRHRPAGLLRGHPEGPRRRAPRSTSRSSPSTAPSTRSCPSPPASASSTRPSSASATRRAARPGDRHLPAAARPRTRSWGRSAGSTARSSAR